MDPLKAQLTPLVEDMQKILQEEGALRQWDGITLRGLASTLIRKTNETKLKT